jgi:hypothetical protein
MCGGADTRMKNNANDNWLTRPHLLGSSVHWFSVPHLQDDAARGLLKKKREKKEKKEETAAAPSNLGY